MVGAGVALVLGALGMGVRRKAGSGDISGIGTSPVGSALGTTLEVVALGVLAAVACGVGALVALVTADSSEVALGLGAAVALGAPGRGVAVASGSGVKELSPTSAEPPSPVAEGVPEASGEAVDEVSDSGVAVCEGTASPEVASVGGGLPEPKRKYAIPPSSAITAATIKMVLDVDFDLPSRAMNFYLSTKSPIIKDVRNCGEREANAMPKSNYFANNLSNEPFHLTQ